MAVIPGPSRTAADARISATDRPVADEGPAPRRVRSLDAVRGLAIVIMLMNANPGSTEFLWDQLQHPAWEGLHFADLFFPVFLFAIGTAIPYSRRAGSARLVARRVGLLFLIGVAMSFVKSLSVRPSGVLQHIAIAYLVAQLILRLPRRWQILASVGLLGGAWASFVLWPGDGGDPFAHHGTVADVVNEATFGYATTEGVFQSVVSSVTIVAGVVAGRFIRDTPDRRAVVTRLSMAAAGTIAVALVWSTVVPLNKHLWTPSFAALTIGTSLGFLAIAYWLIDMRGHRWPTFLIELGMNPIAVYVLFMAVVFALRQVVDVPVLSVLGSPEVGAMATALAWAALGWLFAHELHRRRWYLKI